MIKEKQIKKIIYRIKYYKRINNKNNKKYMNNYFVTITPFL